MAELLALVEGPPRIPAADLDDEAGMKSAHREWTGRDRHRPSFRAAPDDAAGLRECQGRTLGKALGAACKGSTRRIPIRSNESIRTLPGGFSEFVVSDFAFRGQLMATAVWPRSHTYMVSGLTAGAVKG